MEIIVILTTLLGIFILIAFSFSAGVAACQRYHRDLRAAERSAVRDYRDKERALYNLTQQEVEYYKRAIVAPSQEPSRQDERSQWSNADGCVAFVGRREQFPSGR